MDAAAAAAMSDPERNRQFRRRWHEAATAAPAPRAPLRQQGEALGPIGHALLEAWRRKRERQEQAEP